MRSEPAAESHRGLVQRLAEAEATIRALLSGQIDAMVDAGSETPVLLFQAQHALRQSEAQYRQIVEATSDGIVKLDLSGGIEFVNPRFGEMLGWQPDRLLGTSLLDLLRPAPSTTTTDALLGRPSASKDGIEATLSHRDGHDVAVNLTAVVLADVAGVPMGTLVVIRDVTQQKKLQSQLMVSDRMASMGTLAAGVAHEINNPLAAVIANLDYVAANVEAAVTGHGVPAIPSAAWLAEEVKGPLDDARLAADRVRHIVKDLRIFSRSPEAEARGPSDVRAVMDSSLRMAWNEIRHRARVVKVYGQTPLVDVNEARLGQVFLNLLVNAAQALPEGQAERNEIRVTTGLDSGRVVIEVSDTGMGIAPEIIGRVFEAFFTTKAVGSGTGLGLAICQRIVTDMGGQLSVTSQLGQGTCFRVAVPVATRDDLEITAAPIAEVRAARRGKILVVDDEEIVLRAVKRSLAKEHDVEVVLAGAQALALCAGGQKFDLILCDLMMPVMTGMDLYRELSKLVPQQASRMIFLTGGAFTPDGRTFLSEPPKENIEKPFDSANLRAIVRRYLG
jgi:PAS domain S-box-containing protein